MGNTDEILIVLVVLMQSLLKLQVQNSGGCKYCAIITVSSMFSALLTVHANLA